MMIVEVTNIKKKDIPLHYRNEYSGEAHFTNSTGADDAGNCHLIEFSIERSALGKIDIQVRFIDAPDYPLVPVIKSLKTYILDLEQKGQLP